MHAYVKTYFEQGGMQIPFNMVDSRVLKDAMANPGKYKNLLVRISGYNAYFVTLNKAMQTEIIERAEFRTIPTGLMGHLLPEGVFLSPEAPFCFNAPG